MSGSSFGAGGGGGVMIGDNISKFFGICFILNGCNKYIFTNCNESYLEKEKKQYFLAMKNITLLKFENRYLFLKSIFFLSSLNNNYYFIDIQANLFAYHSIFNNGIFSSSTHHLAYFLN